jgi:hypothetical protein
MDSGTAPRMTKLVTHDDKAKVVIPGLAWQIRSEVTVCHSGLCVANPK